MRGRGRLTSQSEVSKVYAKEKKMEKGVAFPTCVSINHIVGHVSPLSGADNGGGHLQPGDVVKFDVGVHFDGYAATLAHTIIAPATTTAATPAPKATGKPADVISALSVCYDAIMRCIRPGARSGQVSAVIGKVCADYGLNAVQGVLSHSLERNKLDGPRVMVNCADEDVRVEEFTFAVNEVYAIDVVVSTGEVRHPHTAQHRLVEGWTGVLAGLGSADDARANIDHVNEITKSLLCEPSELPPPTTTHHMHAASRSALSFSLSALGTSCSLCLR